MKQPSLKRLESIDALRGLAALSVVLYHAVGQMPPDSGTITPLIAQGTRQVASFGYAGVYLFFVISGFCIHLRWAKAQATGATPDIAFFPFWKRRWRRLYPPYLVALALFLVIGAVSGSIHFNGFFIFDLVTHVLMLHNLHPQTVYSLNSVFWTLALEEQLYLAYFLLLFVRRRWGWGYALTLCAAARVAMLVVGHYSRSKLGFAFPVNESAAAHWFTWTLGAIAVEAAYGLIKAPRWCGQLRWGVVFLAGAIALSLLLPTALAEPFIAHEIGWLVLHPLWGVGFFVVVNKVVRLEAYEWQTALPLWTRATAGIGLFSYSLYLIHELVLMESYALWVLRLSWLTVTLFVLVPLTLAYAWVFFWYCERPFLQPARAAQPAFATTDATEKQKLGRASALKLPLSGETS